MGSTWSKGKATAVVHKVLLTIILEYFVTYYKIPLDCICIA